MAEIAEKALIGKVVGSLWDKIVKELTYVCNFQSNVEKVEKGVAEVLFVERDVDQEVLMARLEGKVIEPSINWWKGEFSRIKDESDKILKDADKVKIGCLKGVLNVPQRFLVSRKAAKLIVGIAKALADGGKCIKLDHHIVPAGLLPASSTSASDDLESRKKLTEQVMAALKKDEIYVIGICGMVGVGKTRLADQVKKRVIEEQLFEAAVKVEVSKDLNIPEIQSVIAQNLGLELNEIDEDGRARRLRSRLTDGSKNLVILDNIWDQVPLDRIGLPSEGEQKGCKLVYTSRNTHIPWLTIAPENVFMEPLSVPEARVLFKKIACECDEDIANKIADECDGLPIVVETVASALRGRRDPEVWESALTHLKESSVRKEERLYTAIKLSYDILGERHPQAQPLLLLCCLFPERADIPYQKLVRYAKGLQLPQPFDNLVKSSNGVFELLDDLKKFSFIIHGDKEMTIKMVKAIRKVCLSISSEEDKYRIKVEHNPKLMQWPVRDERRTYFAISLKIDDQMQRLPDDLVYPELQLLQLQFHCDSFDMPDEFFNGMKKLTVLDIKRQTRWGEFIKINSLPLQFKFLTNLRTLCVEFCDLSAWDLSQIESLTHLEVLSFFSSKLVNLPCQIQQLTNLKLLDLRCADGPQFIPSNVLPALTKLEDLYLGNFDSWSRGMEQSVLGQGASITELSSLSSLRFLQVRVKDPQLLLEIEEESWFNRLRRYQIAAIRDEPSFREYEIGKSITFDGINWNSLLDSKVSVLLSTTKSLTLKVTSFKNLFTECSCLQILDLYEGKDVEFIMEAEDSVNALNKLKCMVIKWMEDLKVICKGDLPPNSLIELETVKLDSLPELTHLWSAPIGSGCLVNLRVFEMSYCKAITCIFPFSVAEGLVQLEKLDIKACNMLEWIVSGEEERAAEKLVLKKLSFLSLDELPSFRSFFPDSSLKTLTENRAAVEVNPLTIETAEKNHGCGWFTRKQQATRTKGLPMTKALFPTLKDLNHETPVLSSDNIGSNMERLFNQLVELPSMNKLLVRSMNNQEKIVDDQTSRVSVSKIRTMHVSLCEKLLNLASSEYSIRSLQNLEKVNVDNCPSMQAMFDFGNHNVDNQNAEPLLNKLETITLKNLNNLNHVFGMVPEGIPCFKHLNSLTISSCCSLNYVLSISMAKMLGNLQDLKVKGCEKVEEIIEKDVGHQEVTDTIQFPQLRVLQLEGLHGLTSFSSGNHDFEFPQLQDLLVQECPSMKRFCRGQVTARRLKHVRKGDQPGQRVSINGGLNITIQQLYAYRVELASTEIEETE